MKQEFREFISGFNDEIVDEVSAFGIQLQFLEDVKDRMRIIGINQKELSEKMAVHPSFLSNVFNGNKLLNLKHIAKIERILNIDISLALISESNIIMLSSSEVEYNPCALEAGETLKKQLKDEITKLTESIADIKKDSPDSKPKAA
ncbi:MAG: helix-turn-helix transcriptional regulator [Candidatus Stygibacter australis]|nr:helix-turn-helix transcriptional regulator [Candidatus Stygibacter australis]MDP8322013.1 helix-turn-helix transcriptional regulator [Candidatus Stygibacter australis]